MASSGKGKGSVKTVEWWKHLRPFNKRLQNKRVRKDGEKQIEESKSKEKDDSIAEI